jgi:hypothetical protein
MGIRSSGERIKFTHTNHIAFPSLAEQTIYKSIDLSLLHHRSYTFKDAGSPTPELRRYPIWLTPLGRNHGSSGKRCSGR